MHTLMRHLIFICCLLFSLSTLAQEELDITVSESIDGTLLLPQDTSDILVILVAGSGPTDRNGNQNFVKNNSLKKLATALTDRGFATFRFDKRIVKQIKKGKLDPNISFDDFVVDVKDIVQYFKSSKPFKKIYIVGHSQGSLVGMLAATKDVNGFISLAGAGQSIDLVITDQIEKTAPQFTKETKVVFDILRSGKTTTDYPPALSAVFDISIQKFITSWMKYNPQEELKKLNIPILIINGTKDLQVSVAEAELLKQASPNAPYEIIEKMNHVLFSIEGDDLENAKSYNAMSRPLAPELVDIIVKFLND